MPRTQSDVINGHKSVMKYFQSAYDLSETPLVIVV